MLICCVEEEEMYKESISSEFRIVQTKQYLYIFWSFGANLIKVG